MEKIKIFNHEIIIALVLSPLSGLLALFFRYKGVVLSTQDAVRSARYLKVSTYFFYFSLVVALFLVPAYALNKLL